MKHKSLCLVILLASFHPLFAGNLTPTEKKIIQNVNRNAGDAITMLEKTVNINSGTMNHEGVRQVGDLFRKEFDSLGFETRWIDMPAEVNRAGHLFAERKGTQGKRLLLIGHLDTVFEKDSPFSPFTRNGSRATGQGVNDMKGGDVVLIFALKALNDAGALKNTRMIVAFTGDEEKSGAPFEISRKDLVEAARASDVALAFESGEGDTGTIARRGVSSWTLKVTGTQAHSSGIFGADAGAGAIFETARILNTFYSQLAEEKYLTFNPGVILGGTEVTYDPEQNRGSGFGKTNVIARTAVVHGDLRFISTDQREKARQKMREIVAQSLPKTSAQIEFEDGYPAMFPSEGNTRILNMLDQVSRDLGDAPITAFDPGARGAGDISFAADYDDCLDGLGAMGNGGHTPDEDVDLATIPQQIQRAAILIYRLTR
jgi:glutamate carboxypeptidase